MIYRENLGWEDAIFSFRPLRLKIYHLIREIYHHFAHTLQQTKAKISYYILEWGFAGVAGSVRICPRAYGIHHKVRHHEAFRVKNFIGATALSPLGDP